MQLKEELTLIQRGSQSVLYYLNIVKRLVDELTIIDTLICIYDIMLYILNGIGAEFRDIATTIRTRETSLTFEELHDVLISHENYLKRIDSSNSRLIATVNAAQHNRYFKPARSSNPPAGYYRSNQRKYVPRDKSSQTPLICQLCDTKKHSAKTCRKVSQLKSANCASTNGIQEKKWLMDSTASHHITSNLTNLSIHSEYDGTDDVVISDGSGLKVTHVGSMSLSSLSKSFLLHNTLCVPNIHKNLVSVHNFTRSNNIYIEFHSFYFLVKDRNTGTTILRDDCQDGVYPLPQLLSIKKPPALALVGERTSLDLWHTRLGHPSTKICCFLISCFFLLVSGSSQTLSSMFSACQCNKSHQLSFSKTSLISTYPLEYIYTYIWGLTASTFIDGYRYYALLVDHFTKYRWLFPIHHKNDVRSIFIQLKGFVEKQFGFPIKNLYSDNGGKY